VDRVVNRDVTGNGSREPEPEMKGRSFPALFTLYPYFPHFFRNSSRF